LTFRGFWRQHFNYGRRARQFRYARSLRHQKAVRTEPPSFYGNMLGHTFAHPGNHGPELLASLLLLSQVANAVGFFYEGTNRPRWQLGKA
jgi:hypothetical protein